MSPHPYWDQLLWHELVCLSLKVEVKAKMACFWTPLSWNDSAVLLGWLRGIANVHGHSRCLQKYHQSASTYTPHDWTHAQLRRAHIWSIDCRDAAIKGNIKGVSQILQCLQSKITVIGITWFPVLQTRLGTSCSTYGIACLACFMAFHKLSQCLRFFPLFTRHEYSYQTL